MEPRISFVTLGVSDLERSTRFYGEGLRLPRLKSPPTVSFFELGRTWLALYPRDLLAADAGVPADGSGFPGFTLAHNVRSKAEPSGSWKEFWLPWRTDREAGRANGFLWEVPWNPRFLHV